jgi:hypothetical protein
VQSAEVDAALELIQAHFDQFTAFTNVDTLNLRNAMVALQLRVSESGLTAREVATPSIREAVEWAVARGSLRVDQITVVSFWSALEVLIEDLFTVVCACVELADVDRIAKIKIPLAQFVGMSEAERYQTLWRILESNERGDAADRWDALLGLIGVSVDVANVATIPDWPTRTNASVRSDLREAQQVRNVILHRGGRVDRRLERVSHGAFATGSQLLLSADVVDRYSRAAIDYAQAAGAGAFSRITDQLHT